MNQTLTERACSIRLQTDMSEGLWAETVSHVSYLVNMSLFTAVDLQISEDKARKVNGLFNLMDIRLPIIQFG